MFDANYKRKIINIKKVTRNTLDWMSSPSVSIICFSLFSQALKPVLISSLPFPFKIEVLVPLSSSSDSIVPIDIKSLTVPNTPKPKGY